MTNATHTDLNIIRTIEWEREYAATLGARLTREEMEDAVARGFKF